MKWFDEVKKRFSSTSSKITQAVSDLINKKHLDYSSLQDLEEALLKADLGVSITSKLIAKIKELKFDKKIDLETIKEEIAKVIAQDVSSDFNQLKLADGITVVLVCGVNGNGKTTTIGKLAHYYKLQGCKIVLSACDTFRAAAQEQLKYWADKTNVSIIAAEKPGADPASVAYKALEYAKEIGADLLLIDTAGRLNNNKNLMEELAKIRKVIAKLDPSAPHYSLLVLDATTGQNALQQVKDFKNITDLNGIILTKMDGTAKAGAIINIIEQFKTPVYFIGTGEKIGDLEKFDAYKFAYNLFK
jgi:fused signal recognition particle receptor